MNASHDIEFAPEYAELLGLNVSPSATFDTRVIRDVKLGRRTRAALREFMTTSAEERKRKRARALALELADLLSR